MNKCLICGSRSIKDYQIVKQAIEQSKFPIDEVVQGDAAGVDLLSKRWANENNVPVKSFPVNKEDYSKWGKQAPILRNIDMVKYICPSGSLIAVHDGVSKGTDFTIKEAIKMGIEKIYIFIPDFKKKI